MAKDKENKDAIFKLISDNKYNNFSSVDLKNVEVEEVEKIPNSYSVNTKDKLTHLNLSGNKIHSLHFLIENAGLFTDLEYLNLSDNLIRNLCWYPDLEKDDQEESFFTASPELKTLDLSGNNIRRGYDCLNDLKALEELTLTNETVLDLSNKGIKDISFIDKIKGWKNFTKINLANNPYINDKFSKYSAVIKEAEEKNDNNCIEVLKFIFSEDSDKDCPQKIMLLGNHAVGKSTFLNQYDEEYKKEVKQKGGIIPSTPVLSIHTVINKNQIFYDFGGQDYYHGINQLFFTENALNLLFWCEDKNENCYGDDSRNIEIQTRNFTLEYWLSQLKYVIHRRALLNNPHLKLDEINLTTNPILLIQTFANKNPKRTSFGEFDFSEFKIINDFYIDLSENTDNELSIKYIEKHIQKSNETKKLKKWEVNLEDIITQETNYEKVKEQFSDKKNFEGAIQTFKNIGKILFGKFKDKDGKEQIFFKNNPQEYVEQLHSKVFGLGLTNKGVFYLPNEENVKSGKCKIKNENTDKCDTVGCKEKCVKNINDLDLNFLLAEKIIFKNINDKKEEEYIIPSYLPLAKSDRDFNLLKNLFKANPKFTLKFQWFIPFGLINQLICYFGNLPDKKHYWRDNVIFTFLGRFEVWMELNFEKLSITVYIEDIESQEKDTEYYKRIQDEIKQYLKAIDKKVSGKERLKEEQSDLFNNNITLRQVEQFIFYKIWELFWSIEDNDVQFPKLNEEQTGKPNENFYNFLNSLPYDMYLSVDNEWFVKYSNIHTAKTDADVLCYTWEKNTSQLDFEKPLYKPLNNFKTYTMNKVGKKAKIFISYAHDDTEYRNQFDKHLSVLKDEGIEVWFDDILIGTEWDDDIKRNLKESNIVMYLISSSFISSNYIKRIEANKEYVKGKRPIPIVIRDCDWRNFNDKILANVQAANNAQTLTTIPNLDYPYLSEQKTIPQMDTFWANVVKDLRNLPEIKAALEA